MLSVLRVHLPSDIPIAGCELCPYVLLRKPDGTITTEDIPDTNPIDGYYIRCRWYRVQSDKRVAVCSVHPNEPATLQCLGCVKAKLPIARSYHCSPLCFQSAWPRHRALHSRGLGGSTHGSSDGTIPGEISAGGGAAGVGGGQRRENGGAAEEEELFGKFNSGNGTTGLAGGGAQGGLGDMGRRSSSRGCRGPWAGDSRTGPRQGGLLISLTLLGGVLTRAEGRVGARCGSKWGAEALHPQHRRRGPCAKARMRAHRSRHRPPSGSPVHSPHLPGHPCPIPHAPSHGGGWGGRGGRADGGWRGERGVYAAVVQCVGGPVCDE
ncbi:hypothetical protein CLOM_g24309 [Closterium sp. NIES-68]|nr:hypothetical protein CLOM_g24309 [Closterium sp. NIES-68]